MLRERVLHFNWRLAIAHMLVNALALGLTVLILPGLSIVHENTLLILLISGLIFGVLNAIVRPFLQFIMFNFLFATFGLVLVIINFILLYLLGRLTPGWFQSEGWTWLLLGAVLVGLFGVLFENLLGLTPPIIDRPDQAHQPDLNEVMADSVARLFEHTANDNQEEQTAS